MSKESTSLRRAAVEWKAPWRRRLATGSFQLTILYRPEGRDCGELRGISVTGSNSSP
jgi:hypothetical protein